MPPKKVVKVMNQKGQKGNKVTVLLDQKVDKKGKAVQTVVVPKRGQPPSQAELKAKKKAEAEALAAQERMLFRAVPSKAEVEAKKKAKEEKEQGSSPEAYAHLQEEEEYRWTAEDFEPIEEDETRLEEQLTKELEELREKLAQGLVKGTPVNPETFVKWKLQKKREKEAADRKAKAKAIRSGALTGKMLYEMDDTLFKDDEDAEEFYERQEESEEEVAAEGAEGEATEGQAKATDEDVDAALFADADIEVEDVDDVE